MNQYSFVLKGMHITVTCRIHGTHRRVTLLHDEAWGCSSEVSVLSSSPVDLGPIPCAAILERTFILATSAIRLISEVPVCLLGLTQANSHIPTVIYTMPLEQSLTMVTTF